MPLILLVAAVRHTLEHRGVLPKLRADLRLAVYSAVNEQERALGLHKANAHAQSFRSDGGCHLALALIVDTLTAYGLTNARACLLAEAGLVRLLRAGG